MILGSVVLTDFTTPQTVSTLTVLSPFTQYPSTMSVLLFALINLSASETVTLTIETSEDGTYPDTDKTWAVNAGPTTQASVEVGPSLIRSYWRVSANTQSPSFNSALVKWRVKGFQRR